MTEPLVLIGFARVEPAELLANYLSSQQLAARVITTEGQHPFQVVLDDPRAETLAMPLVQEFLQHPHHPKYQQSAWEHGNTIASQGGFSLTGLVQSLTARPVTSLVLLLCALIHLAALMGWQLAIFQQLQFQGLGQLLQSQQWWRLIGPALIHFSALHIIFNLLWWWILGGQVEEKLGRVSLSLVFMITALASNTAEFLWSGPYFGGLSGVVYGLMGFVWWLGWLKPGWGINLPKPLVGFMLVWLVLGYADVLWVNMANAAHTMGLVSGCLLAVLYSWFSPDK